VAVLLLGALFAKGRRTVTSLLRAAHVGHGFAAYYYFLAALGRHTDGLAGLLLRRANYLFGPHPQPAWSGCGPKVPLPIS
jgi:hypothetical protein